MAALSFIIFTVIAYLFGSLNSAIIVSRLFALPDPCAQGSRNPGATNVLRLAGKQYALIVLLGDVFKGIIPVLIARFFDASLITLSFTCFAAVMGHMYPVFFGFKGGKGVATTIGALLALNLFLGVLVIATWVIVANYSRYSSLASIVSVTLAPIYSLFIIGRFDIIPPLFFILVFILYKHRENISRLIDGTESKIKFHKNPMEPDINIDEDVPVETVKPSTKKPAKTKSASGTAKPKASAAKTKTTPAKKTLTKAKAPTSSRAAQPKTASKSTAAKKTQKAASAKKPATTKKKAEA